MKRILLIVLSVLFLCGCATPAHKRVFNQESGFNKRTYEVSLEVCWQAVSRVVLGQGFSLEREDSQRGFLQASRYFQQGKRTTTLIIQINLKTESEEKTTVYLTAVETAEKVYVRGESVPLLFGLISLPRGQEAKEIKEGTKTVEDRQFYERFFKAVEKEIKDSTKTN